MGAALIVIWTMQLGCWPFEVEGQGTPSGDDAEVLSDVAPQEPLPTLAAVPSPVPLPVPLPVAAEPPAPVGKLNLALPPTLPLYQEARYDIRYGLLGSVGSLSFSVGGPTIAADGSPVVKVKGTGHGAVLGLGGIQRKIDVEFDPATLESRRWTTLRVPDGRSEDEGTRDTVARQKDGHLLLSRTSPGQPPLEQNVTFPLLTLDPLGLLWRLRTQPPTPGHSETVQLLDGRTLWRVRLTAAAAREILPDDIRTALRLDGEVSPIFYDGRPDDDRPSRRFTLWLSDATDHLPLRLEAPVGIADVVMVLAESRQRIGDNGDLPPTAADASRPAPASAPPPSTPVPASVSVPSSPQPPTETPAPPPEQGNPLRQLTGPVPGARTL